MTRLALTLALLVGPAHAFANVDDNGRRAIIATAKHYGYSPAGMLRVAGCESAGEPSGHVLRRWATNGQYLGLFQLGAWARRHYLRGHWANAWANADAAARLARDTGGFHGGQWECGWAY